MYNNTNKIMFKATLIGGIMMTFSSNSWLGAWMGLEINLLSFIPLMSNNENILTTEASMKYFLVQALASSILIFIVMLNLIMEEMNKLMNNVIQLNMIMSLPLMLKMGVAPLHWWFPSVMEGLTWMNCLILLTLQKIAPILLTSNVISHNWWFIISILMSNMVGSIGGLNQTSTRKILAYSSINHMGWLMMSMVINMNTWIIYFITYVVMTVGLIKVLKINQLSFINQTFMQNMNTSSKLFVFMMFLSMAGLPPLLGFLPKWMIIQHMVSNNYISMGLLMIISSLITLYFYLRVMYASILMVKIKTTWESPKLYNVSVSMLLNVTFTLTGLLILPLYLNLYY
nr:NADH dehydrogenase subunit 2 [Sorineuchora shanensis]